MFSYAKGKMSGMTSMITGGAANPNANIEEEEKDGPIPDIKKFSYV